MGGRSYPEGAAATAAGAAGAAAVADDGRQLTHTASAQSPASLTL